MMGRQTVDQSQLFYLFNLEGRIPARHLLRRINPTVTRILTDLCERLEPFYSEIGRPSVDPELIIRMLIVGYCYGICFERRLCKEVELHLAYRWGCRLDLDHSTFSVNRHGCFREGDTVFEAGGGGPHERAGTGNTLRTIAACTTTTALHLTEIETICRAALRQIRGSAIQISSKPSLSL